LASPASKSWVIVVTALRAASVSIVAVPSSVKMFSPCCHISDRTSRTPIGNCAKSAAR
jgi:hypothetical protein